MKSSSSKSAWKIRKDNRITLPQLLAGRFNWAFWFNFKGEENKIIFDFETSLQEDVSYIKVSEHECSSQKHPRGGTVFSSRDWKFQVTPESEPETLWVTEQARGDVLLRRAICLASNQELPLSSFVIHLEKQRDCILRVFPVLISNASLSRTTDTCWLTEKLS